METENPLLIHIYSVDWLHTVHIYRPTLNIPDSKGDDPDIVEEECCLYNVPERHQR